MAKEKYKVMCVRYGYTEVDADDHQVVEEGG